MTRAIGATAPIEMPWRPLQVRNGRTVAQKWWTQSQAFLGGTAKCTHRSDSRTQPFSIWMSMSSASPPIRVWMMASPPTSVATPQAHHMQVAHHPRSPLSTHVAIRDDMERTEFRLRQLDELHDFSAPEKRPRRKASPRSLFAATAVVDGLHSDVAAAAGGWIVVVRIVAVVVIVIRPVAITTYEVVVVAKVVIVIYPAEVAIVTSENDGAGTKTAEAVVVATINAERRMGAECAGRDAGYR
jgi:hypothetical protein